MRFNARNQRRFRQRVVQRVECPAFIGLLGDRSRLPHTYRTCRSQCHTCSAWGALTIEKLSLVDDLHGTAVAYGNFAAFYAAPEHWRRIRVDPAILAFENRRVMPRAWFGTPLASDETSAVKAIRGGLLPSGARFDERRDVLTGLGATEIVPPAAGASFHVVEDEPARQTFMTSCTHACFLVIRDAFDPEWRVAIDGRAGRIVPADIALRGIALLSGAHRVTLTFLHSFQPRSTPVSLRPA